MKSLSSILKLWSLLVIVSLAVTLITFVYHRVEMSFCGCNIRGLPLPYHRTEMFGQTSWDISNLIIDFGIWLAIISTIALIIRKIALKR